jgi:hypothetical protein
MCYEITFLLPYFFVDIFGGVLIGVGHGVRNDTIGRQNIFGHSSACVHEGIDSCPKFLSVMMSLRSSPPEIRPQAGPVHGRWLTLERSLCY